jgi:hydroxypyruvate isomerase
MRNPVAEAERLLLERARPESTLPAHIFCSGNGTSFGKIVIMTYELSICAELLFREHGPSMSLPQLTAIRSAGFDKVEFWSWRDKDVDAVERALKETGSTVVSMIGSSGAADPRRTEDFVGGVRESIAVAQRLGATNLVVLAGDRLDFLEPSDQRQAIIDGLSAAAPSAEEAGVTLLLENLNSKVDHVGTFLDSTALALEIVGSIGSAHVKVLYDLYHSVVMEESIADVIAGSVDLLGHVQVADHPGRHEPGSGQVDWGAALSTLATLGYGGAIGLEYAPSTSDTLASVRHIRTMVDELPRGADGRG